MNSLCIAPRELWRNDASRPTKLEECFTCKLQSNLCCGEGVGEVEVVRLEIACSVSKLYSCNRLSRTF